MGKGLPGRTRSEFLGSGARWSCDGLSLTEGCAVLAECRWGELSGVHDMSRPPDHERHERPLFSGLSPARGERRFVSRWRDFHIIGRT